MGVLELYTNRLVTIGAAICFIECGLLPLTMAAWELYQSASKTFVMKDPQYHDDMNDHHHCHSEEHLEGPLLYLSYAMQLLLPLAILSLIFNYYVNKNLKVLLIRLTGISCLTFLKVLELVKAYVILDALGGWSSVIRVFASVCLIAAFYFNPPASCPNCDNGDPLAKKKD